MKLQMIVVDFEIPPRMKRRALLVGIPIAAVLVGGVALAMVPHTFTNGQVLNATDLNDNFGALDTRLTAAEGKRPAVKSYSLDALYCGKTSATTGSFVSGNLTGWTAAKDLCQTACSASKTAHMCTGEELVRSAQVGVTTADGWFAAESFAGYYANGVAYGVFECVGWTSTAATVGPFNNMGSVWNAGPDHPTTGACSASNPILCCD